MAFSMNRVDFEKYCKDNILNKWKFRAPQLFASDLNEEIYLLQLDYNVRVQIPFKLASMVQFLWKNTDKSQLDQLDENDGPIMVWHLFLKTIYDASFLGPDSKEIQSELDFSSVSSLLELAMLGFLYSLDGVNIHARTQFFTNQVQILTLYYKVLEHLKCPFYSSLDCFSYSDPISKFICEYKRSPALLESTELGNSSLFAIFGGQGPQFFKELIDLYFIYPKLRAIVDEASSLFEEQSNHIDAITFYQPHGFKLKDWINQFHNNSKNDSTDQVPNEEFILSAPVSCPLIYLTQMLNYVLLCQEWNRTPGEVCKLFKGATGHSQGLLAALTFCISKDDEQLRQNIIKGCCLMQWFGIRLQQQTPAFVIPEEVKLESKTLGFGPTPKGLLSIRNLSYRKLNSYIEKINFKLSNFPEYKIELALQNGVNIFVVVGHPVSLHNLLALLSKFEILSNGKKHDQNRIPYSKRKVEFTCRYLDTSVPFHWSLMKSAVRFILDDAKRLSIAYNPKDMVVPLVICRDALSDHFRPSSDSLFDMRTINDGDSFLEELILYQGVSHINWIRTLISIQRNSTHIIDFGPGGFDGIGVLSLKYLVGSGVHLILNTTLGSTSHINVPWTYRPSLFDSKALPPKTSWAKKFGPTLLKRRSDGKLTINTKFTRLYGKPPLMVSGMTPTTADSNFVSLITNSGYHCELAGGGLPTKCMFYGAIENVNQNIVPGDGIWLNLLYLNPSLWNRQIQFTFELCKQGYPIDGITIAAGVPSLDSVNELICSLIAHGIRFITFKPGSVEAILLVLEIALNNPKFSIILQWTGGRGGGHHSFEDFHEPILLTYAKIRELDNVTLIAGSGFGDGDDSWPYLTGEWSEAYGYPRMPFDAILFASRVMVCKEAKTCLPVKELIVRTPGVEHDSQWENSYDGISGGIITVRSELGEPIHVIANKGALLWRDLDKSIFSLPMEERGVKIEEMKWHLIERINREHQKLYFGRKFNGKACNLSEMTYAEVAFRIVELCFFCHRAPDAGECGVSDDCLEGHWFHEDFAKLLYDFLERIEERFYHFDEELNGNGVVPQLIMSSRTQLENYPRKVLSHLINEIYPESRSNLISSEDVDFFISLCKIRGRKPINFIPVIDKDLEYWFKKDSLWQSENLESLPEQDVGRAFILQGPVSVKYSKNVNEPVKELLDKTVSVWIQRYSTENPGGGVCVSVENFTEFNLFDIADRFRKMDSLAPIIDNTTATWTPDAKDPSILVLTLRHTSSYQVDYNLLFDDWIMFVSYYGSNIGSRWFNAFLMSPYIIRADKMQVKNFFPSFFHVKSSLEICLFFSIDQVNSNFLPPMGLVSLQDTLLQVENLHLDRVSIVDNSIKYLADGHPAVVFDYDRSHRLVNLTLYHVGKDWSEEKRGRLVPLVFSYKYVPEIGRKCIIEAVDEERRVKEFYASIWFETPTDIINSRIEEGTRVWDARFTNQFQVKRLDVELFSRSIKRPIRRNSEGLCIAPVDFAIVAGWESIMKVLFLDCVKGNMLKLVHLSNSFNVVSSSGVGFLEGEVVQANMRLVGMINVDSGEKITVSGIVRSDSVEIELTSEFLIINGRCSNPFFCTTEKAVMKLASTKDIAILKSKEWIHWRPFELERLVVGDGLVFVVESIESGLNELKNTEIFGKIYKNAHGVKSFDSVRNSGLCVADISWSGVSRGSLVSSFLARHCSPLSPVVPLKKSYLVYSPERQVSPLDQSVYASCSGDMNPIHTNSYFALVSGFKSTIVHGMWSSASCRGVIESLVTNNCPERILEFKAEFVDVVKPGDSLITRLRHTAMSDGCMIIEFRTEAVGRADGSSNLVVKGTSKVLCPKVAYVFTGQGSAEVGMGMDLYASSPIAKRIWDFADEYFMNTYNFSIIKIVRENPKEIRISFGGKKGLAIRKNYQDLNRTFSSSRDDKSTLLFPTIDDEAQSYTFYHNEGLLFATQFSQPALVLTEMAAFEDLKSHGLISEKCIFAGHSLGEYAALASVASVLSIRSLVETVFLRGMTMQSVVKRDALGRSPYAMIAVNPTRVRSKGFEQSHLDLLIDKIVSARPELLQIVNYNVFNYQYVAAGERGNLSVLTTCLNILNSDFSNWENLDKLVSRAIEQVENSKDKEMNYYPLNRGVATIPLNGIDVPFHSRYLESGVPSFRNILKARIDPKAVDKDLLMGLYVSNLIARPFSIDREYIQSVYDITKSDVLSDLLKNYESEIRDESALSVKLLIELLAYQFASPVRWIETQHLFFSDMKIERLIEIGPAPTLSTMAKRTLEIRNYFTLTKRQVLWYGNAKDEIFYNFEDAKVERDDTSNPSNSDAITATSPASSAISSGQPITTDSPASSETNSTLPPASSGVNMPPSFLENIGVEPLDFVKSLLSIRLKRPINSISGTDTLGSLSSGKSAFQNEILGELEAEFGTKMPENASSLSLSDLAQAMGSNYKALGKVGINFVHKMISNKMPGGFGMSNIKSYLSKKYNLGANRIESVLIYACTMEPANRLGSESEVSSFLDSCMLSYSSYANFPLVSAAPAREVSTPRFSQSTWKADHPIPDAPPDALTSILVILSVKTKRPVDQISPKSSIRDIVAGKSTLQNELIGDLSKEFNLELEGVNELNLEQLAAKVGEKYLKLGPVLTGLINKFVGNKMPAGVGMNNVKSHLASRFGFGSSRSESVLIHAITNEPKSRFSSEVEAYGFIDSIASNYAQKNGIPLSQASDGGGGTGDNAPMEYNINSAEFKNFENKVNNLFVGCLNSYSNYLGMEIAPDGFSTGATNEKEDLALKLENKLKVWIAEHGDDGDKYFDGIIPIFDAMKERRYNSYWNWVRQDFLHLYYDYTCGRSSSWSVDIKNRLYMLKNRVSSDFMDMLEYYMKKTAYDGAEQATEFINSILASIRPLANAKSKYFYFSQVTRPRVSIDQNGVVHYEEVPLCESSSIMGYLDDMRRGPTSGPIYERITRFAQNPENYRAKLGSIYRRFREYNARLKEEGREVQDVKFGDIFGAEFDEVEMESAITDGLGRVSTPYLSIRKRGACDALCYDYCSKLTDLYFDCMRSVAIEGISLAGKVALVTGCGRNSIGLEVLAGLLRAGARVYATTSHFSAESCNFYRSVYNENGGKGSELIVLPFNQGSIGDIQSLVDYIYVTQRDNLDFLVPFAAIPDNGNDIGNLNGKSQLAHRIMLTNLLRLIGAVKNKKVELGMFSSPTLVLLPLSFNHGIFGYDGMYSESKLGLEALLNKWYSEDWGDYILVIGAIIGWTRGTGLMNQNNVVAEGLEKLGARTFSIREMGFNLISLFHGEMVRRVQDGPLVADLNGCLDYIEDLKREFKRLHEEINSTSAINRLIANEKREEAILKALSTVDQRPAFRRSNFRILFPELPEYNGDCMSRYRERLGSMLDLDSVIVVVGFGEFGPYGSSRTRWEMESYGEFSLEGCVELAWIMGLIKYVGVDPSDPRSAVWVDAKTGKRVSDVEIKSQYEQTILDSTGIRLIEPHLFDDYDPKNKMFLHQVALNQDLGPIEVGQEEAKSFSRRHKDHAVVYRGEGDSWFVKLKKGAILYIPKALKFDYFVAGQIPSTWDPKIYGIPQDIIQQVDRVTLFTLVSTVDALISAGVTDPYEFYEYVHVSELGNTIGGGFGGMQAIRDTYRSRFLDIPVQGDILQETFINTVAAWINMLLLSSSGPIKTPVGACATSVESVEIGIETIKSRKARICVVGGYDDFGEEGSYEFASMKATVNSAEEVLRGRVPKEMSRPSTSSRAGFVESHGAGVQILMTAALAIEMGVPIYAILESSSTATDKASRSVPAPGQGILVTARESNSKWKSGSTNSHPLLDLEYRRRHLMEELKQLDEWKTRELDGLKRTFSDDKLPDYAEHIEEQVKLRRRALYSLWSHEFYTNNANISPLRGALSVYGLTVDDIQVASFHGTGTRANDTNECQVLQKQLEHLGRSKGNVIFSIFQKSLTGHPKGAAAAWMLNGLIQSILSGIVPGNFNADNIDPKLEDYDRVVFLDRPLRTYGYKAGLLKSFGFGQVGAEILVIHPDFVFSQLSEAQLVEYSRKRLSRQIRSTRHWQDSLTQKSAYIKLKQSPPYDTHNETNVYLDPLMRATYNERDESWKIGDPHAGNARQERSSRVEDVICTRVECTRASYPKSNPIGSIPKSNMDTIRDVVYEMSRDIKAEINSGGIGVDVQFVPEIEVCISNNEFVLRNFTDDEIRYCKSAPDPPSSFAGKWAAKEAVLKAISSAISDANSGDFVAESVCKDPGAPLKDIEIVSSRFNPPTVRLHGRISELANRFSLFVVKVTVSHSGDYAIAQAFTIPNVENH